MKPLYLWLLPLAVLSPSWALQGSTTVQMEMHTSTTSFSPDANMKASTPTAGMVSLSTAEAHASTSAATVPVSHPSAANKAALPGLVIQLNSPTGGRQAAEAIRKIDPAYEVPAAALTRLVRKAKVMPAREKTRTGWITTCDEQDQALDTLAALGPSAHAALPDLVRLSHRTCIHEHVVNALNQIGAPDKAQIALIAAGLNDPDPEAKQAAIEYLAKADLTPENIHTLGRAMNDPNSGVRLSAVQALEEIHPEGEGRLPFLASFLKDPSPEIRQRAIFMVGQLGPQAKTAVPLLHEALKDPEPLNALAAANFLSRIDPQDEKLISTLIGFMKVKGSAEAMQAAPLLESLNIHEARVDEALEPYRTQQALLNRFNKALSVTSPEQLAEHARTLKVEKMRVASGIIRNQPVRSAKTFPADVGRLYCWTEISISSAPAGIVHRWYRNGRLQHEAYLEVVSTSTNLWSSSAVRPGEWKVEVLPAAGKEPLATALFTVAKRKK